MSIAITGAPLAGSLSEALAPQKNRPSDTGSNENFAAARSLIDTLQTAETSSTAYLAGAADPHSVVEAIARAELAVETVVTVRNKVVEAYQELMRMPI